VISASLGAMAPHASLGLSRTHRPDRLDRLKLMQAMIIGIKLYGIIEGGAVPDEFIPRLAALHAQAGSR